MTGDPFAGGVAVITGSASGLGRGFVERAAARRMRIALADVDRARTEQHARDLAAQGVDAVSVPVDVTRPADLERLAETVWSRWGRVDLLVNNAGITVHGKVWDMPVDAWRRVIDVNLNGVFYGLHAFLPRMVSQPGVAHVINVASTAALTTVPFTAPYAASKHAVMALTEVAAHDLDGVAPHIVMTVAIPSGVRSEIFARAPAFDDAGGQDRAIKEQRIAAGADPAEAAETFLQGAARRQLRVHLDPARSAVLIEERAKDLADLEGIRRAAKDGSEGRGHGSGGSAGQAGVHGSGGEGAACCR